MLPLVECSTYSNPQRSEGEHTGWAELLYDSNDTALQVRKFLQGERFKILRPYTEHDPLQMCSVQLNRSESDPVGYLRATCLPYNVTQADVQAFFDIRPSNEYSVLRRDRVSAVLAMRHFKAAAVVIASFDCSRPWGLTSDRLSIKMVDPSSAARRVYASNLPFALNEKLHDPEKILKDLMHKEKDLMQNMLSLPIRPLAEMSRVYCQEYPFGSQGQDRKYGFSGEASVTFVHEALGKMALTACGKDKKVSILNETVKIATAIVPRVVCTGVEYMQEDLCKMMLACYNSLRSSVTRMAIARPLPMGPALHHQLRAQDQRQAEQEFARRACVAGFSMSEGERQALLNFLKEMCGQLRGNEKEWVMIDAVIPRHELTYMGQGVFNSAQREVDKALEDKKKPVLVVYGPSGCGKSCFLARVSAKMKTEVAEEIRKRKEEAEAAAKKSKKKPAAAPKPGGAKKKEATPVLPQAQTRIVSCFKSPWDSLSEVFMFLLQEIWGPVAAETEREELAGKDVEMRKKLTECGPGQEVSVFCEALVPFFAAGLNQTIILVVDGFEADDVNALSDALKKLKDEARGVKLWCIASICTAHEDDILEARAATMPIKLPMLTRPEATAILYAAIKEFGPHMLRKPITVFMRFFKEQAGNPRYLRTLAQIVCSRPLPVSLTGDIDMLQPSMDALMQEDFLPLLEQELNPNGALYDGVSNIFRRQVLQNSPSPEAAAFDSLPVERILRMLYEAGRFVVQCKLS